VDLIINMTKLLLLAALNLAVFIFAISVQQRLFRCKQRTEKLFVWMFLYVSVIVVLLTVLGLLQILWLVSVSMAVVLLLAALYLLMRPDLKFLKRNASLIKSLLQDLYTDRLLFISSLLVGLVFFYKFLFALISHPYEEDSLYYHIPIAASFLQSGNFLDVCHYNFPWSYPSNSELLSLWFILPFHNDALVNLQNFPVFIGLCCLGFLLCSEAGLERKWCIWGALLTASFPSFIEFLDTQKNDVLVAFFVLSSVLFLERFGKRRTWIDLFCGALSLGLLIGTKLTGLLFALVIITIYGALFFFRRKTVTSFLSTLTLLLLGSIFVGSFWYVRNAVIIGNPVYPVPVKIAGHTIFDSKVGIVDSTSVVAVVQRTGNPTRVLWLFPFAIVRGSHGCGVLFLISCAVFLCWRMWQRRNRRDPPIRYMIIALVFLFVYCFIPFSGATELDVLRKGDGMRFISGGLILGALSFIHFYQGKFKSGLLFSAVAVDLLMNPRDILLGLFIGLGIPKEHFLSIETMKYVLVSVFTVLFAYILLISLLKHVLSSASMAKYLVLPLCTFVLIIVSIKQEWRAEFYSGLIKRYAGERTDLFRYVEDNIKGKKLIVAPMSVTVPFYDRFFNNQVWATPRESWFVVGNEWEITDKDYMIICGNYSPLTQEQLHTIPFCVMRYLNDNFHAVYSDGYSFVYERNHL
jgi:hypothetical protein